jgi:uncharacterized protein (TIRG00374 family)
LAAWLSARQVRWQEMTPVLKQADLFLLCAALASVLATTVAKAARWHLLLRCCGARISRLRATRLVLVGQLGNSFLPARLGDAARAVLAGPETEGGAPAALGTLVPEKALDGTFGLLLLIVLAVVLPLPTWLRGPALLLAGLVQAGLLLLILATGQHGWSARIRQAVRIWLPSAWRARLGPVAARFAAGIAALHTPADLFQALAWSAAVWGLALSTNILVGAALHIQVPLWTDALILVTVYLATLLPAVPAQVGVFEYACILPLTLAGVAPGPALAFGLTLHLVVYAPPAILGSICAATEGVNWHSLKQQRPEGPALRGSTQ